MNTRLFLSWTVLLLSVYGVRCHKSCEKHEKRILNCYESETDKFFMKPITHAEEVLPSLCSYGHDNNICLRYGNWAAQTITTTENNLIKPTIKSQKSIDDCKTLFPEKLEYICSKKFPNVKQNLKIIHNSFLESIKFVCRDDAKYLIDFHNSGDNCKQKSHGEIENCKNDYSLITILGNYSESFCSSADKGLDCISESVSIADCNEMQRKMLYDFYQTLKFNTPCKNENKVLL